MNDKPGCIPFDGTADHICLVSEEMVKEGIPITLCGTWDGERLRVYRDGELVE